MSLNLFDYMYHGWPGQMAWILIGMGYALMTGRKLRERNFIEAGLIGINCRQFGPF